MQRFLIFLVLLSLFACQEFPKNHPEQPFSEIEVPAGPDYSQLDYWVAHPGVEDQADGVPVDSLTDNQSTADADVFFIYPTMLNSLEHWNAPLDDAEHRESVESRPIKHQASIFNGSCRVYSPHYRQMTYGGFFCQDTASRDQAANVAYRDIKAAFEYYLKNENKGRPIVIAGHSQGSFLGMRLVKEFFDGKPLQKQLVAAYLPGWPIQKGYYEHIEASDSATHLGSVNTWNTFLWEHIPIYASYYKNAICTNPLSWKSDGTYASQPCSKGMVFYKYNKIYPKVCDAVEKDGYLWIHKPDIPQKVFLTMKNYHIADFNLFWMDVRKNVDKRVDAWYAEHLPPRPDDVAEENSDPDHSGPENHAESAHH